MSKQSYRPGAELTKFPDKGVIVFELTYPGLFENAISVVLLSQEECVRQTNASWVLRLEV